MDRIVKRNGQVVPYDGAKIILAIEKSFLSVNESVDQAYLSDLLVQIEAQFDGRQEVDVEEIQDTVEKILMKNEKYNVAKSYILYREKRTQMRNDRLELVKLIGDEELEDVLVDIQKAYPDYDLKRLYEKFSTMSKEGQSLKDRIALLTRSSAELTTKEEPNWERIAGRLLSYSIACDLKATEEKLGLTSFYHKISYMIEQGLYGAYILENYSHKEVDEIAALIDNTRNNLFTYSGLDLLSQRYLIRSHQHVLLESPQEMYIGIAMHLAMKETNDRIGWVKKFYDMMSLHQVTMATPTQANARKPYHQLSSCFIDTVPDSLDGIYHSISNFADVSKFGGGMGMYLGKVRSRGGSIRGFEGASGGVIRWIRVINDTAVAVDQLGVRAGAVAVYLDVWHKDLPEFLQLRTNNGDDRMKAHDVFPAVCYPDLFWKMVKEDMNQDWYLLDPHDVLMIKGYCLEDF